MTSIEIRQLAPEELAELDSDLLQVRYDVHERALQSLYERQSALESKLSEIREKIGVRKAESTAAMDELCRRTIAKRSPRTVDDGFGTEAEMCDRLDCGLHVVRPGDIRCYLCDD